MDIKIDDIVNMGALCELERIELNGVFLDSDDFVTKGDESPCTAEDYGCGNMVAEVISVQLSVLDKYKIAMDGVL